MVTQGSECQATIFRYENPNINNPNKVHVELCSSEIQLGEVQIVGEEGANELHSHTKDGFWMVLRGGARFYTVGDEVVGELGKYEGIHISRGFPYWFESTEDQELEILHVVSNPDEEPVDLESKVRGQSEYYDGTIRSKTNPRSKES